MTLLVNHVLASEPVATERLRAHAGRSVQLQLDGWPALLPPLSELCFRVTPAGLIEWAAGGLPDGADLRLRVDASDPARAVAQWATGERPRVDVQGDAQFAADVSWVIDNLRWDVQDDLARLVGQAPARELARIGALLGGGLREAVRALSSRWPLRGGAGDPGPAAR